MALQRPARLLRFDKMIENKGLTRIRVGSNCRRMRVFRDHESETGKVPLAFPGVPYAGHLTRDGLYMKPGRARSTQVVYLLTTRSPELATPTRLRHQPQLHWKIENCEHDVRDTPLREDDCRMRTQPCCRPWTISGCARAASRLWSGPRRHRRAGSKHLGPAERLGTTVSQALPAKSGTTLTRLSGT